MWVNVWLTTVTAVYSPLNLAPARCLGRVLIKRGRQWLLSGEEQTSQIGAISSAFDLCVQPVSATLLVVYRLAFGSPRSFADVD